MNQTNLEIINIAFTISDDYIKHCCNCILSILENNKNNFFKMKGQIYIMKKKILIINKRKEAFSKYM